MLDLNHSELDRLLSSRVTLKRDRGAGRTSPGPLAGQHVALLFDKPSLRTRATFVIAIHELGGQIIEPLADAAFAAGRPWATSPESRAMGHDGGRPMSGQARLQQFAAAASGLHVINALTAQEHPCQALADFLTLQEHLGTLAGRTLAFVGDGNNVAASLAHAGAMLGVHVRMASPAGFELPDEVVDGAKAVARSGCTLTLTDDPIEAVTGADAVYTDAWASMGQEHEADARALVFRPYQVNASLMAQAGSRRSSCTASPRTEARK